ncbi:MAG: peptidyl-prolyl cis-trans isomerase [Candidatus Omnitrophica bacterium]|nr:peptidyl-prolyl cis-trans isomerase [Candidatus Omnitrophota bacterium]
MKTRQFKHITLLSILVLSVALTSCKKLSAQGEQKTAAPAVSAASGIAIQVGDWKMTKEQFEARVNVVKASVPQFDGQSKDAKKMLAEEIVRQQLLVADAKQKGLANKKEVEDAVEDFRNTMIAQAAAAEVVKNITATDEEIKKFYDAKKEVIASMATPPQFHLAEIVTADETKTKEALARVQKGEDFAVVAKAVSTGKSAANGGDLGFLSQPVFPEMGPAVASLKEGGVSEVFKGPEGFYIVKLTEKKIAEAPAFEKVKSDLVQPATMQKQQEAVLKYIEDLKTKNKVVVNDNLL